MRPRNEREFAVEVVRTLRNAGHQALWAGGCVRDELLGLVPKDYDVATSARPEEVQRLFRRTVAVGASFGVIEVLGPRVDGEFLHVQAATFRTDGPYVGGRWPEYVVFSTAEEDAKRRDFTINGMFFDPLENQLIDYVGGGVDLDTHVLRAIGEPRERFEEDRLRMLRGARLAARFDFAIEARTADAIVRMAPQLGEGVSAERIADELRKMLVDRRRAVAMRLFMDLGLAAVVMPELVPMRGLPQGAPRADGPALPPPGHAGQLVASTGQAADLWDHVLRVLELLPEPVSFALAAAALLHDIGKPRTVGRTADRYTFHGHEHVGKRLAGEISQRLKLANDERERIEWLVEKHQILADAPRMRPAKLKVLLVHPGIFELFALHRADALASGRGLDHVEYAEKIRREWEAKGELAPPHLITGEDLIAMGLKPGPLFKTILDQVREAQLDGTIRTREDALAMARTTPPPGPGSTPPPSPLPEAERGSRRSTPPPNPLPEAERGRKAEDSR
jgi:poly(A) polymerase